MFLLEVGGVLLIAVAIAMFVPRAALFVGPFLMVGGLLPVVALIFVPATSQARIEEQYGMLSTIVFLVFTPAGALVTLIGYLMRDR
jgi:hypothetical protein